MVSWAATGFEPRRRPTLGGAYPRGSSDCAGIPTPTAAEAWDRNLRRRGVGPSGLGPSPVRSPPGVRRPREPGAAVSPVAVGSL